MVDELQFYKARVFELTTKVNQLNVDNVAGQSELLKLKRNEKWYRIFVFLWFIQWSIWTMLPHLSFH